MSRNASNQDALFNKYLPRTKVLSSPTHEQLLSSIDGLTQRANEISQDLDNPTAATDYNKIDDDIAQVVHDSATIGQACRKITQTAAGETKAVTSLEEASSRLRGAMHKMVGGRPEVKPTTTGSARLDGAAGDDCDEDDRDDTSSPLTGSALLEIVPGLTALRRRGGSLREQIDNTKPEDFEQARSSAVTFLVACHRTADELRTLIEAVRVRGEASGGGADDRHLKLDKDIGKTKQMIVDAVEGLHAANKALARRRSCSSRGKDSKDKRPATLTHNNHGGPQPLVGVYQTNLDNCMVGGCSVCGDEGHATADCPRTEAANSMMLSGALPSTDRDKKMDICKCNIACSGQGSGGGSGSYGGGSCGGQE